MNWLALETSILDGLQMIHNPTLDTIMVFITNLGNSGAIWIMIGVLLLFVPKYRKGGVIVLAALLLQLLLGNMILKNLFERPRPCWINDSVSLLIKVPRDYSFPSGHTMSAFAASAALYFTNKKLGIAGFVLAAAIAFSRLYLYVHYPTDILGGMILGVLVAFAARYIVEKSYPKQV